jgi:carboxymethylenebutenolidase
MASPGSVTAMPKVEAVKVPGDGRQLDAWLAVPDGPARRHPAVVVIHEIFGPDAHIQDVARRFAAEGYVALAPNLFTGEMQAILTPQNVALGLAAFAEAPPDPALRRDPSKLAAFAATQPAERRPILQALGRVSTPSVQAGFARDLLAAARYLRLDPAVDVRRTGSVGFCFGGAMSARLATVDPDLRAAVIFYGQNPPLEDVPKIHAAVLGLYGGEDPGITGQVPALAEAMRASGKSFASHVYPGAKHAFFNDTRPANYQAEAAQDAWKRLLAFFHQQLA